MVGNAITNAKVRVPAPLQERGGRLRVEVRDSTHTCFKQDHSLAITITAITILQLYTVAIQRRRMSVHVSQARSYSINQGSIKVFLQWPK